MFIPEREEKPAFLGLVGDDVGEIEFPEDHEDRDDGEAEGDLVGDHLGAGANSAEEGIFRVGRPPREGDAVDAEGGNCEDEEGARSDVCDDQFYVVSEEVHVAAEGDDADRDEGGNGREGGCHPIERFTDMPRGQVLLEKALESVGERLQETEEAEVLFKPQESQGNANPVGTHPVLHDGAHAALGISRVGNQRQDHHEGEKEHFDAGDDERNPVHDLANDFTPFSLD